MVQTLAALLFQLCAFAVFVFTLAGTLYCGARLYRLPGSFASMLGIAVVTALFLLVPWVGWIAALVWIGLMFCKVADADFWPHAFTLFLFAIFTTVVTHLGFQKVWIAALNLVF